RDWQYKSDGLFRIPDSAQGSVAVVLSLWRFEHFAHRRNGYYMTSHNVHAADNTLDCEVDYAYVFIDDMDDSYEIVIGQATRFSDFTDVDMQKMSALADKLPRKPYIAFSTLKDRFSDADKTRFKSLVEAGYRVIALTREELDPYDLYDHSQQHLIDMSTI
ncbi:MAG: hypothetical protein K2X81_08920, partial [Candidatus Obscuribacterales bacterium]|nr:hypothetical protein [Candidatus Obscuribacterales bacterium]